MMLDYLRTYAHAPEAAQGRPDAAEIRRLEQFLGFVDNLLAAHNERAALRMATDAIAHAARNRIQSLDTVPAKIPIRRAKISALRSTYETLFMV